MKENFEHIETLFKGLKDSDVALQGKPSWDTLTPKVQKLNFFKPRITSFNVFYAALIAGTFLASGYLAVDNIIQKNSNKIYPGEQLAPVIEYDTLVVNDTLRITDTIYNRTIATYKKEMKLSSSETTTTFDTILEVSPVLEEQDFITSENPEQKIEKKPLENSANVTRRVKKKVTIVKTKQVIVRDTVKVNKGI